MFAELADVVRCIHPHRSDWLILSADRMEGRHVVSGRFGCAVCGAEYPIRDGEAHFEADAARGAAAALLAGGTREPHLADGALERWLAAPDGALRLAALLALTDVRQPVLLTGLWGRVATALADALPASYIVADPDRHLPADRPEISVMRTMGVLPLAARSLHGAALDGAAARDGLLDGAVRSLRPGGRLVAPAAVPVPDGVVELARDETLWVAERPRAMTSGPPVALTRASRDP